MRPMIHWQIRSEKSISEIIVSEKERRLAKLRQDEIKLNQVGEFYSTKIRQYEERIKQQKQNSLSISVKREYGLQNYLDKWVEKQSANDKKRAQVQSQIQRTILGLEPIVKPSQEPNRRQQEKKSDSLAHGSLSSINSQSQPPK